MEGTIALHQIGDGLGPKPAKSLNTEITQNLAPMNPLEPPYPPCSSPCFTP